MPVSVEEFSAEEYVTAKNMQYDAEKLSRIENECRNRIATIDEPVMPYLQDVNFLISLFDIEDNEENRKVCMDILVEQNEKEIELMVNSIENENIM